MKNALLATVAALGLTVAGSAAHAFSITETTDFSDNFGSPTALGTLDLGLNTISGRLLARCENDGFGTCIGPHVGDDVDFFTVEIAAGTQLTDVTLNLTNFEGRFFSGGGRSSGSGSFIDTFTEGAFVLQSAGSFTGTALFETRMIIDILEVTSVADYRFDLTVAAIPGMPSAVPLPAGLPLLLAGFGGLAALRKRKSA